MNAPVLETFKPLNKPGILQAHNLGFMPPGGNGAYLPLNQNPAAVPGINLHPAG
jgi:hypothetical protein